MNSVVLKSITIISQLFSTFGNYIWVMYESKRCTLFSFDRSMKIMVRLITFSVYINDKCEIKRENIKYYVNIVSKFSTHVVLKSRT